jgi:hypothetical protein
MCIRASQVLRIVVRFVSRTGEPVTLVHLLSSPDGSPEDLDTSAIFLTTCFLTIRQTTRYMYSRRIDTIQLKQKNLKCSLSINRFSFLPKKELNCADSWCSSSKAEELAWVSEMGVLCFGNRISLSHEL